VENARRLLVEKPLLAVGAGTGMGSREGRMKRRDVMRSTAALSAGMLAADSDEAGQGFRFQAGRCSDLMPATVPT
jgi:hypothetical protein